MRKTKKNVDVVLYKNQNLMGHNYNIQHLTQYNTKDTLFQKYLE